MVTCTQCGIENRETARYCMSCGAALAAVGELKQPAQETLIAFEPADGVEERPAPADAGSEPTAEAVEVDTTAEPEAGGLEPATRPEETNHRQPTDEETDATDAAGSAQPVAVPEETESGQEEPAGPSLAEEAKGQTEEASSAGVPEPAGPIVLPPLEPGTRLDRGRFEILTVLEENPNTLLYDALDFGRCPQCGYAESVPGDLYCAQCGVSLVGPAEPPHVLLRSLRLAGEAVIRLEEETEGRIESWFEAGGRLYAVLPAPASESETADAGSGATQGLRQIAAYRSDAGSQRDVNEDTTLAVTVSAFVRGQNHPNVGLYAIADGMGGHESGEIASRIAIEALSTTVLQRLLVPELAGETVLPETPPALLKDTIRSINESICQLQRSSGSDMGTTLTAALVRGDSALIANVGDSRTYLWRDARLVQITMDHSLVAQLVAAGAIGPEEAYTHPEKGAIYRSLGHSSEVEVDLFTQPLVPGDRLLLCSDGVWEMLHDDGIEEVLLSEADPQRACDEIVRRSNLAGGEDNISVIVVQFDTMVS